MTAAELKEFMALKGWNNTQLAATIDVTEVTVARWLQAGHVARGPASILLREWLERARAEHANKEAAASA